MGDRRWAPAPATQGVVSSLAVWAVPAGDHRRPPLPRRHRLRDLHPPPVKAFAIWDGGLGIPGGIAAGVITGLIVAHHRGLPLARLLDVVAPVLPLAQAIGRWGNWFNQELFGRPSTLPWAVRIDLANRPTGYEAFTTFQPTFLYESLWNLAVVGIVLLVERQHRLRPGRLFAVYIAGYALGRFLVERMRIDFAHTIAGLRVNEWTSLIAFVVAIAFVITGRLPTDQPQAVNFAASVDPRNSDKTDGSSDSAHA